MKRCAIALSVLAGCDDSRHVDLLIGPSPTTVSSGYACVADDNSSMPARGFEAHPGTPLFGDFDVNLVVDFISLDGGFPGCRGEEIATWCSNNTCAPMVGQRWCGNVHLDDMDFRGVNFLNPFEAQAQVQAIIAARIPEIYGDLHALGNITDDAPDVPVIIRGVATTQDCDEYMTPTAQGVYPPFNLNDVTPMDDTDPPAQFVGCAYSCPVVLDEIDSAISLSIDSTYQKCEPEVVACAGDLKFANRPDLARAPR